MTVLLQTVLARLTERPGRIVGDDDWTHAAVAAVFRDGDHGAELLLIQRAHHDKDPWSGQMGFPGGRAEPGDESLEATAMRETQEELGLDLSADHVRRLGALDQLQARARTRITAMAITPFAFVVQGPAPPLTLNHEVEEAFWIPLNHLADPARRVWFDASRSEDLFRFRAVDLGRQTVLWGLTHFMVVEILHRLGLVDDVDALTTPRARV
jgi:8-oxo-dGTP pyrophosphatase MutT (NUDIX family)